MKQSLLDGDQHAAQEQLARAEGRGLKARSNTDGPLWAAVKHLRVRCRPSSAPGRTRAAQQHRRALRADVSTMGHKNMQPLREGAPKP